MQQTQYGTILTPSYSFTRPANTTAYSSGQLMANSTTAGSVVPLSWTLARDLNVNCFIRRAYIKHTNAVSFTGTLSLFGTSPTTAVGDGGTFAGNVTSDTYLGSINFGSQNVWSDAASVHGVPSVGSEININLPASATNHTIVYGLLAITSSYTPTSGETITVQLEVFQNYQ